MRVLACSDVHLDHVTLGVPRNKELRAAMTRTLVAAVEEEIDLYIFAGDLCDPDSGVSVFRCVETAIMVSRQLAYKGIASIWLAGNHDVIEDGSGDTTLTPMRHLGDQRITVAEQPGLYCQGRVLALPFTATSHAYNAEEFVNEIDASPSIVIAHLSVRGIIPGEETTEMPRGRDIDLPVEAIHKRWPDALIIQGHYHRQQVFRHTCGAEVHIPGSLARLTFGEENHTPGYMMFEVT